MSCTTTTNCTPRTGCAITGSSSTAVITGTAAACRLIRYSSSLGGIGFSEQGYSYASYTYSISAGASNTTAISGASSVLPGSSLSITTVGTTTVNTQSTFSTNIITSSSSAAQSTSISSVHRSFTCDIGSDDRGPYCDCNGITVKPFTGTALPSGVTDECDYSTLPTASSLAYTLSFDTPTYSNLPTPTAAPTASPTTSSLSGSPTVDWGCFPIHDQPTKDLSGTIDSGDLAFICSGSNYTYEGPDLWNSNKIKAGLINPAADAPAACSPLFDPSNLEGVRLCEDALGAILSSCEFASGSDK